MVPNAGKLVVMGTRGMALVRAFSEGASFIVVSTRQHVRRERPQEWLLSLRVTQQ